MVKNNFVVTPKLLEQIIQSKHKTIRIYEDLIQYSSEEHAKVIEVIRNDQKGHYELIQSIYKFVNGTEFDQRYIQAHHKINSMEEGLKLAFYEEVITYDLYTQIYGEETNHQYNIYFYQLLNDASRHAALLNFIYSDVRGCQCHKHKENRNISMSNQKSSNELMNKYWEQHVWWTRQLIIGIIHELGDINETTKRILQNPGDIASLFIPKYGKEVAKAVENLITEHLVIGKKLIEATKAEDKKLADELNAKWYRNADDIALALHSINREAYSEKRWKELLYSHLDMTKMEVGYRIMRQFDKDIANFDNIEREALMMAAEMSKGL